MAWEPPVLQKPVTLLALSLPPLAARPALIPATASHWLCHAEPSVVGPLSCWLWPQWQVERTARGIPLPGYVFGLTLNVLKRGCACEALSLITLRRGFHVGKVAWSVLQTRPHMGWREVKIKRWCSTAPPIRKRLMETSTMFGVCTKEWKWANMNLKWVSREIGQIAGWKLFLSLFKFKNWLLLARLCLWQFKVKYFRHQPLTFYTTNTEEQAAELFYKQQVCELVLCLIQSWLLRAFMELIFLSTVSGPNGFPERTLRYECGFNHPERYSDRVKSKSGNWKMCKQQIQTKERPLSEKVSVVREFSVSGAVLSYFISTF